MEMEPTIVLECGNADNDYNSTSADPRLSQIGDFKLQASGQTITAFLAFSQGLDDLFVCPLNESYSNKREPFKILHNSLDKAENLGFSYDTHSHGEIHLMEGHLLITANNKEGKAEVVKVDIQKGIDQAKVVDRIQIESKLEFDS